MEQRAFYNGELYTLLVNNWQNKSVILEGIDHVVSYRGIVIDDFCGRIDLNGRKIFTGDICIIKGKEESKRFIIERRSESEFNGWIPYELSINKYHHFRRLSEFISWDSLIVIGNSHQNKELLPDWFDKPF